MRKSKVEIRLEDYETRNENNHKRSKSVKVLAFSPLNQKVKQSNKNRDSNI